MLCAKRFERVEEALYYYYQYTTSTVHTVSEARCRDRMHAMEIFLEECGKRGFYREYKREIDYKFFELYYKNTLFSYMQGCEKTKLSFIRELKKGLLAQAPDFAENPYYQQNTDPETRKLIGIHMKSNLYLYIYYKLLHLYRKIRYRR